VISTARSVYSIRELLGDLPLSLPVIGGNGALLSDYATGRHLDILNLEGPLADRLIQLGRQHALEPVVARYSDNDSRIFYEAIANEGMAWCIAEREAVGDRRLHQVDDIHAHTGAGVVSLTCIGREKQVQELAQAARAAVPGLSSVLYENTYTPGWFWLSFQHGQADKGSALVRLLDREGLGGVRTVVFGDNHNDLPLFAVATQAVAVANAPEEIRLAADSVIGYNDADAVVAYILQETTGS
jgi:hydroxymethylpyrimidine pyrophosphatase-like HAD family hydrolase